MRSQQKSRRSSSTSQSQASRRDSRSTTDSQARRSSSSRRSPSEMGKRDKWLWLNVGGTYFMTASSTLTRLTAPNSPLCCLSGNSTNVPFDRDDRGAFLIDRDPGYFAVLLNFLRHGHLLLTRDTTEEGVLIEAEFFNVPELERLVKQRIQNRTLSYLINQQQQQQSSSSSLINVHHRHQQAPSSNASAQLGLIGARVNQLTNQLAAVSTSAGSSLGLASSSVLSSGGGISSGSSSSGSRGGSANAAGANTMGLFNSFGLGPIAGPTSGYSGLLEV